MALHSGLAKGHPRVTVGPAEAGSTSPGRSSACAPPQASPPPPPPQQVDTDQTPCPSRCDPADPLQRANPAPPSPPPSPSGQMRRMERVRCAREEGWEGGGGRGSLRSQDGEGRVEGGAPALHGTRAPFLGLEPGRGTLDLNSPLLPPGDKQGLASGGDALDHEA